jgi:imidazole glycerol-phosphate synthase subunit HisH
MIAIIDYGVGNLRSVEKALQFVGGDALVTSDLETINKAEAIVLPGVGAFSEAMKKIKASGVEEAVKNAISSNKPFLGICLGMQMLFDYSEEGGDRVEGLKIFKGCIKKIPQSINMKIPHMGWNTIKYEKESKIFKGIEDQSFFYFVHSYYLECKQREIVAGTAHYGIQFDAAINIGNIYATQYHPEKSGEVGLKLLKNFVESLKTA